MFYCGRGSNPGPSACKADVMTTIQPQQNIIHEKTFINNNNNINNIIIIIIIN